MVELVDTRHLKRLGLRAMQVRILLFAPNLTGVCWNAYKTALEAVARKRLGVQVPSRQPNLNPSFAKW